MAIIPPLELETWILSLLSGSQLIFLAVALTTIVGMAAFFRMTGVVLVYLLVIFLVMFEVWIPEYIYFVVISAGIIIVAYWIGKMVKG